MVDATRFVTELFGDKLAKVGPLRTVKWVVHRRARSDPLHFHFDSAPAADDDRSRAIFPRVSVALYLVDDPAALLAAVKPELRCGGAPPLVVDGDPSCAASALEDAQQREQVGLGHVWEA